LGHLKRCTDRIINKKEKAIPKQLPTRCSSLVNILLAGGSSDASLESSVGARAILVVIHGCLGRTQSVGSTLRNTLGEGLSYALLAGAVSVGAELRGAGGTPLTGHAVVVHHVLGYALSVVVQLTGARRSL